MCGALRAVEVAPLVYAVRLLTVCLDPDASPAAVERATAGLRDLPLNVSAALMCALCGALQGWVA
jgi:hypothetical protein